jgi:SAM-dependent methyltransferase
MPLKQNLRRLLPGPYTALQEVWTNYQIRRVNKLIKKQHGLRVQQGPFAGMTYVDEATCSTLAPKLIGSYEAELHPALAEILATEYTTIIDVGCAEGYYAVGLALQMTRAKVYAFDIDAHARTLCKEMARLNFVENRVFVEEACTHLRLRELIDERTLVVCDCEGCEFELLRPEIVSGLDKTDLLVELHDFINPRIKSTLVSRFELTHHVLIIETKQRMAANYRALDGFNAQTQLFALAELRGAHMEWAFLRSRVFARNE